MNRLRRWRILPLIALLPLAACRSSTAAPTTAPIAPPSLAATTSPSPLSSPSVQPTPALTAVSTPGATTTTNAPAAVQAYRDTVNRQAALLRPSLQRANALSRSPRLTDANWKAQVTTELTLWKTTYQEAQHTQPPACMAAAHEQFLGSLKLLDTAGDTYAAGIETGRTTQMNDAGRLIAQANASMSEAERQLSVARC